MSVSESGSTRETILVVEDCDDISFLECLVLRRVGFRVVSARTESAATELLAGGGIDLVLLDYHLSAGKTGLDLYFDWKQLGFNVPVVIVTGCSREALVIEALRAGVRDYVTKSPDFLEYLPEAVTRVLREVDIEKRLAESEARFHAFMDNSPAIAFIKDEQGRMLYANRLYQQIFRVDGSEGETDQRIHPSGVADRVQASDMQAIASGGTQEVIEAVPMPDGSIGQWLTCKFPMTSSNGAVLIGSVALDITERIRADQELRRRDEQLRQVQKMEAVGSLAGGIAHEFNNLLQAILGYTKFAMDGLQPDDQRLGDLQHVIAASERAADLTQHLLGFSRQQAMQFANVELNRLVQDLVKILRPLIGEHITLNLSLDAAAGIVHADAGQLQQILMHLCVNARDAMPQGGELLIKTENLMVSDSSAAIDKGLTPGSYLVLTVSDNGEGMLSEVKEHIYEPFFTTKGVGKGTGLGLSMVYGAVQQHGGVIRVESEPNEGTTFKIYLPSLAKATLPTTSHEDNDLPRGTETILIAEDDLLVRDLAVRILSGSGYQTITAKDGVEAIELFKQNADVVRLLLLDIVMPRVGGRETYQQILAMKPSMPAIFCSAYDPEMAQVGAVVREGLQFIQKPFDPKTVLRTVRTVLDGELCYAT